MCSPTMLTDEWQCVKICQLTDKDVITLLGRELRVEYAVPSDRGGDFYTLEAYGFHDGLKDVVSFTLDKNQSVYARQYTE